MKHFPILAAALLALSACQAIPEHGDYTCVNELVIQVPAGAQEVRAWMALPQEDPSQKISGLAINCLYSNRISKDSEGNRVLFVEAKSPPQGELKISTSFDLTRHEDRHEVLARNTRPLNASEKKKFAKELSGNANIVLSQEVRDLSARILAGETNPIEAAHKLYDWSLKNLDLWVKSPATHAASANGSSEYCLANKTGSASDLHSLYAALARSAGIPTRILYGSVLAPGKDGSDVDQDSNCWIEFYAPEIGWIPLDLALADVFVGDFNLTSENDALVRGITAAAYHGPEPAKVQYYFGNLESRRLLWSVGRDLELDPKTAAGAVNSLPKAYVEIDGKVAPEASAWKRTLKFTQFK